MEDSSKHKGMQKGLLMRLRKASFPPSAAVGAFASFAGAAMGESAEKRQTDPSLVQIRAASPATVSEPLAYQYKHVLTTGSPRFRRSLQAIAIGPGDTMYALGDGEITIFEANTTPAGGWKMPETATCIAVDRDGYLYAGAAGRIEIYNSTGAHTLGFEAGDSGRQANITSIKVFNREILAADAAARCIRRFELSGKRTGDIGTRGTARGFMLPNRYLDIAVGPGGKIIACDPGRHRVSSWMLDGTPVGHFGRFGVVRPEDFVGCCNPVNVACLPDGKIVTAEKVAARIKVFDARGKLFGIIGPEHFDPKCTHLYLAVDSKGRIHVADPVRLEIKTFSAVSSNGGNKNI